MKRKGYSNGITLKELTKKIHNDDKETKNFEADLNWLIKEEEKTIYIFDIDDTIIPHCRTLYDDIWELIEEENKGNDIINLPNIIKKQLTETITEANKNTHKFEEVVKTRINYAKQELEKIGKKIAKNMPLEDIKDLLRPVIKMLVTEEDFFPGALKLITELKQQKDTEVYFCTHTKNHAIKDFLTKIVGEKHYFEALSETGKKLKKGQVMFEALSTDNINIKEIFFIGDMPQYDICFGALQLNKEFRRNSKEGSSPPTTGILINATGKRKAIDKNKPIATKKDGKDEPITWGQLCSRENDNFFAKSVNGHKELKSLLLQKQKATSTSSATAYHNGKHTTA